MKMAEPFSSSAAAGAGGAAAWNAAGGAAGVAAGATTLAAVVVLCASWPKSAREVAVALITTTMSSLCLGAFVAVHFELQNAIVAAVLNGEKLGIGIEFARLGGVLFACGLPGWFLVRAFFKFVAKHHDSDLVEIAKDVKGVL